MFDIGWTELMVIGVVALIVVGPKDLPGMFRTLGRFTAKARGMAKEFSRAMEDAADEAGVKDVTKTLKDVASPKSMGLDKMKDAASKFEKWDPMKDASSEKGPETLAFTKERATAVEKTRTAAAEKANERLVAEKAETTTTEKKAPAKTAAAKKPTTKKPTTKKTTAKSTSAKKPAVKKAAPKKTAKKKTT